LTAVKLATLLALFNVVPVTELVVNEPLLIVPVTPVSAMESALSETLPVELIKPPVPICTAFVAVALIAPDAPLTVPLIMTLLFGLVEDVNVIVLLPVLCTVPLIKILLVPTLPAMEISPAAVTEPPASTSTPAVVSAPGTCAIFEPLIVNVPLLFMDPVLPTTTPPTPLPNASANNPKLEPAPLVVNAPSI
jgi:hypothetical protein